MRRAISGLAFWPRRQMRIMSIQLDFSLALIKATVQTIRNFCTSQPICGSTATELAGVVGLKLPSPAQLVHALRPPVEKQTSGPFFGQTLGQPSGVFG